MSRRKITKAALHGVAALALAGAPGFRGGSTGAPGEIRVTVCARGAERFVLLDLGENERKEPPDHFAACHAACISGRMRRWAR